MDGLKLAELLKPDVCPAAGHDLTDRGCRDHLRLACKRLGDAQAAKPGMRLVREWNGTVHIVIIGDDGVICWNEREWKSLSEVARAITGTRWSGPAFFGLKRKAAA